MRTAFASILGTFALGAAHFAAYATTAIVPAQSQVLPQSTAIPVRFDHSIDTRKAKPGDTVTARTIQVVILPDGKTIARGSTLTGHVVSLDAFSFDQTPYAHQKPSLLSVHFDTLHTGDAVIPVNVSVRAIASTIDSREASYPHSQDGTDDLGETTMIGGTTYTPFDKMIQSEDGDAIAYNRKNGVFARLIASGSCDATDSEQAVGIFSPDACGAYGLGGGSLVATGRDGSGTFTLALRGHSVKLYAGTTALLQVNASK
jgi:hypothetical protein